MKSLQIGVKRTRFREEAVELAKTTPMSAYITKILMEKTGLTIGIMALACVQLGGKLCY
jgi:hypothetical protein